MSKPRRLSGPEVIKILRRFGFEVTRVMGSHHHLTRIAEGHEEHITVATHGKEPLPLPTLKSIYREACKYVGESEIEPDFYTH